MILAISFAMLYISNGGTMTSEQHQARIIVIKIGGSTLGSHDTVMEDLVALQENGMFPVVVHGGGKEVTEWLNKLSVTTSFYNGLRVTDAGTLKVVTAVLAGLVNKELVAGIQARGGKAVGLCGVDGGLLEAWATDIELGYVGEIQKVNKELLDALLKLGYIPVVAPLSLQSAGELEENGYILNTNGDTAAGEIAAALGAWKLIFLTDVTGICDSEGKVIPELTGIQAADLIDSEVASGGMIPKIKACLHALPSVTVTRIIDGSKPHILTDELKGRAKGTTIA